MHTLTVYIPETHLEQVKDAIFAAGAGRYAAYDRCCWQTPGQGQFRPLEGSNPAIGTHGTALSTIVNYYDSSYGHADFMAMVNIMPWVVKMYFDGQNCAAIEKLDLFHPDADPFGGKCEVTISKLGTLKAYRFVVIFARYQGKWLYCRAKERDSFETAGGHIEQGETPLDAARRELYEETGAVDFNISPAFDYAVRSPATLSHGRVFVADLSSLPTPPDDFEMAEVRLFDDIPDKMRFPHILPVLYRQIAEYGF